MNRTLHLSIALVMAVVALVLGAQVGLAQDVAPAAPDANPVVNIGHFAPFGATPADTSVSLLVNGTEVFTNVVYPQTVTDLSILPAGTYTIEIVPTGTTTVAVSAPVSIAADTRYDLYAIGGANGYTLTLAAAVISTTVPPGKALVTIGHLAPFDSDINLTAVNVCTDAGVQVPGLANVKFGDVAANLPLDPGIYDLKVVPVANGCGAAALDLPPIELMDGAYYDVFVIGTNTAEFPLEVKSFTGLDIPTATVNVGHFAPFASTVISTAVDVRVNGTLAITDFVFGETVTKLQLTADDTLVEILPAGTNTVVLSGSLPLMANGLYDVYAIGGANGYPLALGATVLSTTVPAGKALVTIGHLAPFATPIAATAVNVCTDGGVQVPGLSNVKYGDVAANLPLDPGIYDLKIVPANADCGAAAALDLPPLELMEGKYYDVFVIGTNTAAFPLEIRSFTGLEIPTATVNVGHFAPFGSDVAATAVDVRVNGTLAITGFVFGETATKLQLPAGPTFIEILPAGTNTVVLSSSLPLMANGLYDVYAIGGAKGYPLALGTTVLSTTVPAGKALMTIGHLAPFASPLASTAVNVCTDGGVQVPGLSNVKYGDVAANLPLDPGIYDLKIVPAANGCGTAALDLPPLILAAGDIRDVFAIGLGDAAFPLALASMTGLQPTNGLFLPIILSSQ